MNNKILGIILAAVVIATAVFVFKKPASEKLSEAEAASTDVSDQAQFAEPESGVRAAEQTESPLSSGDDAQAGEPNKETREERLIKEGYVQDPNNPNQMIKEYTDKDGKKHTLSVDKNDEGFEPDARTVKNAQEVLESKRNTDPFEEVRTLKRIDENNINSAMLNGSFRDEDNDIECRLSSITDEKGNQSENDMACFIAPKLGLNFPKSYDKYTIHTDETGYGIIKLSPTKFVRMTWSYENKRLLHGEIISVENGQNKIIKSFAAAQVSITKGEQLKHCK